MWTVSTRWRDTWYYLGSFVHTDVLQRWPTRYGGRDTWVVCTHWCSSTLTQPDMEEGIPGSFVHTHVLQRWPNQISRTGYLGRLYTLMSFSVDPTRSRGGDTWVVCTHSCPSALNQPDLEEGIPGSFVHTDVLQRWPNQILRRGYLGSFVHTDVLQRWPNQIWRRGYLGRLYKLMSFNVDQPDMEDGIPGSFVHTDVLQRWPNQISRRGYLGRLYTLMSFNVGPTRYGGGDTWVVCTHSCPSTLTQPDMEEGIPGSFVHTDVIQRWPNQILRTGYLGRLYTLMSFNVDPTRYGGGDTWVVCTH